MMKDKHGIKDKVAGKFKEVEGKVTGDKARELEGKAQQAKGKVKSKATKLEIGGDPHASLDLGFDCRRRNRVNCRSHYS